MNHIAAIHVLKAKLQMSQEDYRALLITLTGEYSCKGMSDKDLQAVRSHLHKLAERSGVPQRPMPTHQQHKPGETTRTGYGKFGTFKVASPKERKVWALWHALGREGKLDNPSGSALQAWVKRQTDVDQMRFCTDAQMNGLIESLKLWAGRDTAKEKS